MRIGTRRTEDVDTRRRGPNFRLTRGRNSGVECQLPKLDVAGSNPVARSDDAEVARATSGPPHRAFAGPLVSSPARRRRSSSVSGLWRNCLTNWLLHGQLEVVPNFRAPGILPLHVVVGSERP